MYETVQYREAWACKGINAFAWTTVRVGFILPRRSGSDGSPQHGSITLQFVLYLSSSLFLKKRRNKETKRNKDALFLSPPFA